MLDLDKPLNARFYAFGNGDKEADIIDSHIVARDQTKAECKGDTFMDLTSKLCTQHCHEDCDPLYGKQRISPRFGMSCKLRCVFLVPRWHALLCDKQTVCLACAVRISSVIPGYKSIKSLTDIETKTTAS